MSKILQKCNEKIVRIFAQKSKKNSTTYLVDVLWGQPIKLAQVASTSELLENQQNDLVFFKIISSGPQKPQRLTASKIKFEKFGPKILIPR